MALIQPLKRHPLLTYFVLVYVLAWAFWVPLALIHPFSYVLDALGDWMPSLLGILLTALFSGTTGLVELFGRLGRLRVPLIWYAVVLLLLPVLWLISVGIPTLLGLATITIPGVGFAVFTGGAGIAEELGWRGFAPLSPTHLRGPERQAGKERKAEKRAASGAKALIQPCQDKRGEEEERSVACRQTGLRSQ